MGSHGFTSDVQPSGLSHKPVGRPAAPKWQRPSANSIAQAIARPTSCPRSFPKDAIGSLQQFINIERCFAGAQCGAQRGWQPMPLRVRHRKRRRASSAATNRPAAANRKTRHLAIRPARSILRATSPAAEATPPAIDNLAFCARLPLARSSPRPKVFCSTSAARSKSEAILPATIRRYLFARR